MRKRDQQRIADYQLNHGLKQCRECGEDYFPTSGQGKQQKYCSKACKQRVLTRYNRNKGLHKGGYPRHFYIKLWMKARDEDDITAPCHYCGAMLAPENNGFVIEHVIPRAKLEKTKKAMQEISNLVVACHRCNRLKGVNDLNTFKIKMASDSEFNVPEYTGEEYPLEES
tara:strand:- start:249 stop:755 length:507 start_codon:yes stop_codon:yes gene_type:complete